MVCVLWVLLGSVRAPREKSAPEADHLIAEWECRGHVKKRSRKDKCLLPKSPRGDGADGPSSYRKKVAPTLPSLATRYSPGTSTTPYPRRPSTRPPPPSP
ncbi:hypothetical protein VTK73DRAFT_4933 [Phialemonium thermophilum]|uniref:Secreted protein n=1 Tax=Phialemonium thermophilum TaxID=223376 RepID=A0ABR3V4S4_9PEZI